MRGNEYADRRKEHPTVHQPSAPWFHDPILLLLTTALKLNRANKLQVSGTERAVVDDCQAGFANQSNDIAELRGRTGRQGL